MLTVTWARLIFGGDGKRWHIVSGLWSICGRQDFDYPRVERRDSQPASGKLCRLCLAKALKEGL